MSKNLFTKFFVLLLVVGLLFAAAPTGQAEAATYRTWIAQVPAAPTEADTVRIWMNSDTVTGETAGVEYRIGTTYTKVLGTYDTTSYSGANWYADIPAQAVGTLVEYQLFTRNQSAEDYGFSGFNWSYTVAAAPVLQVHNTTQNTYFSTIQAAVDAAADGDNIEVAAGTYEETVEIIDKVLTLTGQPGAIIKSPVLIPARTGTSWKAIVFVHHSNATIDGFTIDGAGRGNLNSRFLGVQFFEADGVLKNSTVTNVTWTPFNGAQEGIGFYAYNAVAPARSVSLLDNTFVNNQKGDVNIYGSPLNVIIEGNTFTGHGNTSILAQNGVSFQGGATGSLTDNTFSGYSYSKEPPDQWNWGATGLLIYQAGDVTLGGGNSLTGNDSHLYIYDSGSVVMGAETFGASTAPVDFGYFVVNSNDAPLDLTLATFPITDPFVLASRIWDGIDEAGSGLASWVDGHLYVTPPDGSIQRAIDLATGGDTIHVAAGTYNEQVNIDKSITLVGPNTGIDPNTGSRIPEAIITGSPVGVTVQPEVGVVTLDGFTVQGYSDWGFRQRYTAAGTETPVHVINNIFDPLANNYWYAVEVNSDGSSVLNNLIKAGTAADASNSIGIVTYDSSNLRIEDNVIGGTPLISGGIVVSDYKQAGVSGVTISGNTINNAEEAIMLYGIEWEEPAGSGTWLHDGSISNVTIDHNIINIANEAIQVFSLDSLSNLVVEYNQFNDVHTTWGTVVDINFTDTVTGLDLSPNWWDKVTGPVPGTDWDNHYDIYVNASAVAPNIYTPWCGDAACNVLLPATKLNMSPATAATTDTCGQTFVDVMVTDVTDLNAYHLEVLFDPSLVTINSVVNGGFLDATGAFYEPTNTIDTTNGRIIWGMAQMGWDSKDGSGSLIRITFTPKVAGEVVYTIDGATANLVSGPDDFSIPFEVTGGATFNFGSVVTNTTKSPTVSYCDLATAVSAATSGDTLRADVDFETTARVNLSKTIIFNTNGHTITRNNAASDYDSVFYVNSSGNLTVNGGGTLISTNGTAATLGAAIQIAGPIGNSARVTLEAGTTLSGGYSSIYVYRGTFTMTGGTVTDGIAVMYGGTANINGGLVQGYDAAISSNSTQSSTNITISGTAVIDGGDGWAIYHPQQGNLNINGGTITGAIGVEMRAGTLTISGSPEITTTGDAILINGNTSGYSGLLSATISGGEFTSTGGYALRETAPATTRTSNIAVSGGRFTGSLGAVQFTTVDPLILKLTDGAYNTDPGATPDYVFEPLDTYLNTTDNYYYIDTIISGTIAAYDLPNGTETVTGDVVDLYGEIPWYPYQGGEFVRPQGNRVGVYITEPEGVDLSAATINIVANGVQYYYSTWADAKDHDTDNFVPYWPLVDAIFPDVFTITVQWNPVSEQVFTVNVLEGSTLQAPPAPVITSDDIQGYYLVGDEQEFHVSMTNPLDGAHYDSVMFKVTIPGASLTDITTAEFYETGWPLPAAWYNLPLKEVANGSGGTDLVGWYGGIFYGGFPLDNDGVTHTEKLRVNFAADGIYEIKLELYTMSGDVLGDPYDYSGDTLAKITEKTFAMDVFPKPVITSTELAGPFQQGQGATVTINVDNVGAMYEPNSFILHLDLPEGTVVVYGGVTYTCTATGCDIPVTLAAGANAIDLAITFNAPFNGPLTVTLVDAIANPDRALATFTTPANVVVYGNVALVTGTVSMQGRLATAGVPFTLTGPVGFAFGPYTVPSVEGASGNVTFTNLAVGTYTLTTLQPRYLNITADLAKTINIATDTDITALWLRGGNAIWTDNLIDNLDLGKITSGYTAGITLHPDADVNFDNKINIQDLALVGGNYDLDSATAYSTWLP